MKTATARRLSSALSLMDNHETRQLLRAIQESATIGGDVYMANQIKDLQRGIWMVRRAKVQAAIVNKPDQKGG